MDKIDVVCFDLDWTLAAYEREPLQRLIFDKSLERLINVFGYDPIVRTATFRPDFAHRGLLIDKATGAVIKMDRHRYVGRGFLGRRRLRRAERVELYRQQRVDLTRTRFYHVDTLFDLAEVNLFSELVELIVTGAMQPPKLSFEGLAADVRAAVDGIHHDGTLKSDIVANFANLLPADEEILLVVRKLALSGKKVLLISNSEWEYTNAVCRHLFNVPEDAAWRALFDMTIVSARKPAFFTQRNPFVELNDSGAPIGEQQHPRWGGTYAGGSRDGLGQFMDIPGERVLYIGDHIYSDIAATKMQSTWRTMLIVSELESELTVRRGLLEDLARLGHMNSVIADLGQQLDSARDVALLTRLQSNAALSAETVQEEAVDHITVAHQVLSKRAGLLSDGLTGAFNPYWGSVFKQGSSNSLFASQVGDFACLYTSRVSNLLYYGNSHYFRVNQDPMPHEHPTD